MGRGYAAGEPGWRPKIRSNARGGEGVAVMSRFPLLHSRVLLTSLLVFAPAGFAPEAGTLDSQAGPVRETGPRPDDLSRALLEPLRAHALVRGPAEERTPAAVSPHEL